MAWAMNLGALASPRPKIRQRSIRQTYNTWGWAGFNVNAMVQPFDFGQPLTFESNSPVVPIDIQGVPPNSPDVCLCGKPFSRPDALRRHIRTVHRTPTQANPTASGTSGPAGRYPCVCCERHRDANSFVRRDNLRQHLKVYHRMNKEGIDGYFRTYH
ncbi:hypothetical protein QBC37DRAFT_419756 [Rhypophila decipiens]|uniref:C2H2-type domain-containing protein n=1 Tax=Rhypophila decipiens TaxID=261697 RepID=A0AAN6YAU0_9PEZI|nr:hypothetical protein QBC37DRAFT_419756 [Rhypophila decipiens]